MNPAVAKWLEEIAAAKATAEAKKATQEPSLSSLLAPNQQQIISNISQHATATPAPPAKSYGIITSYNLRTRKKQLKLVLPPEPRKPGPGECCGNDCDPCVNTLYYQDLEAHNRTIQELKQQYEQACRDLENGVTESTVVASSATKGAREEDLDDEKGLSVRAYRPFKILKKQSLTNNSLLIVCDTPSPSPVASSGKLSTFHILIRFQLPRSSHSTTENQDQKEQQQFVTKAFTPVDLPSSQGKLTFLVKLYPLPHRTSEMFRALQVWSPSSSASTQEGGLDEEMGVLHLRGPVRTGFDLDHLPIPRQQLEQIQRRSKRRVVMIAAGSGVTPMYQILQQYHAELMARRDWEEEEEEEESMEQRQEQAQDQGQVELDLIYCNRTQADIWLRQELHSFSKPVRKDTASNSGNDEGVKTFVRVQHILSSTDMSPSELGQPSDQEVDQDQSEEHGVATSSGRLTPQILQETLTSRHSAWKVDTSSSDMAALSLGQEEPVQIVICGPEAFNRDVVAMLAQIGHSNESGHCVIHVLE